MIVANYFDQLAENYRLRSHGLLWRGLRNYERKKLLIQLANLTREPESIFEIGCGSGQYTELLRKKFPRARIVALDCSAKMLAANQTENIEKVCTDFTTYKSAETFDLVFCAGALEFMPDPQSSFMKAVQLVNCNGNFVFLGPYRSPLFPLYASYHARRGIPILPLELATIKGNLLSNQRLFGNKIYPFSYCGQVEVIA